MSLERIIENLNEEVKDLNLDVEYYEYIVANMWNLLSDAQEYIHPDKALYKDIDDFYEHHKHGLAGVIKA